MKLPGVRSWTVGALVAAALAFLVAAPMTAADWRVNPSGIFHGPRGTNWDVVLETALSWFLPLFLVSWAVATAVHAWLSRAPDDDEDRP